MSFMYDMGQTEEGSLSLLVEMDNCITRLSMTEVDFLPEKQEIIYADLVGNAALAKSIARFNRRSENTILPCSCRKVLTTGHLSARRYRLPWEPGKDRI